MFTLSPKKLGKNVLCNLLERQVLELRRRNDLTIVAVTGSVGKTSTKFAIAHCLDGPRKVIYQEGNYNDRLTVPLVLFGHVEPGIYNLLAWLKIWLSNRRQLSSPYPYDTAVLEIGTDAPGQLAKFAYLKPDLTVLTAVADEHMEYFESLDAVAEEELTPLTYSKQSLINIDDVDEKYLPIVGFLSYGLGGSADYHLQSRVVNGLQDQKLVINLADHENVTVELPILGKQGAKMAVAAAAVAHLLDVPAEDIAAGLKKLSAVSGRMQVLSGKSGVTIIDDTYNASPLAVEAALEVLQTTDAPARIAILGSMNELGADSAAAHQAIGELCDPAKLQLVVTIGKEARQHLAPAAEAKGCSVKSFLNPREAGEYVAEQLAEGTVVLAKGSQNGVFAEEAVKQLLADQSDISKLVRQSPYWLKQKAAQFK
jgi:UDP-N-acetylmuramoyl-tripeptide--D-alanyl-D-alanine ligase